jgi:ribonuclease HI
VQIYTDGACSGNPGPGGWAAVLCYGEHQKEIFGYVPGTTNNRMELFAVISGIGELKAPCKIELFSDSAYLVNAFTHKWIDHWQLNGWKTTQGSMVENQDLWRLILTQTKRHEVQFIKVKSHADHPLNNRCDELARAQIKEYLRLSAMANETSESTSK